MKNYGKKTKFILDFYFLHSCYKEHKKVGQNEKGERKLNHAWIFKCNYCNVQKHVSTVLLSSSVLSNTKYKVEFKVCNKMLTGKNKQ